MAGMSVALPGIIITLTSEWLAAKTGLRLQRSAPDAGVGPLVLLVPLFLSVVLLAAQVLLALPWAVMSRKPIFELGVDGKRIGRWLNSEKTERGRGYAAAVSDPEDGWGEVGVILRWLLLIAASVFCLWTVLGIARATFTEVPPLLIAFWIVVSVWLGLWWTLRGGSWIFSQRLKEGTCPAQQQEKTVGTKELEDIRAAVNWIAGQRLSELEDGIQSINAKHTPWDAESLKRLAKSGLATSISRAADDGIHGAREIRESLYRGICESFPGPVEDHHPNVDQVLDQLFPHGDLGVRMSAKHLAWVAKFSGAPPRHRKWAVALLMITSRLGQRSRPALLGFLLRLAGWSETSSSLDGLPPDSDGRVVFSEDADIQLVTLLRSVATTRWYDSVGLFDLWMLREDAAAFEFIKRVSLHHGSSELREAAMQLRMAAEKVERRWALWAAIGPRLF
jgi:hypothetical protein